MEKPTEDIQLSQSSDHRIVYMKINASQSLVHGPVRATEILSKSP